MNSNYVMHRFVILAITAIIVAAQQPARCAEPSKTASNKVNPFFALCMDTHDAKKRNLSEQALMLKELGYAGAAHLWLDGLPERIQTLDASGLKLFQVYLRLDLNSGNQPPYDKRLKDMVPLLKNRDVIIGLLIVGGKPSDESLDERAVGLVREIADLGQPFGVRVALYPHVGDWLLRVEDAIRVAQKADRKNVGVMFNLCHFLKVNNEAGIRKVLQAAQPYLIAISINGCDSAAEIQSGKGQWIIPLDSGSFDQGMLLKELRGVNYTGPIGLQCYGIPGDAREHLNRSIKAWNKLLDQ